MRAFLDFEASSLARRGTPIEVAWVFEDGAEESWLIRPAPGWDDWDAAAEAIHRIPRATLLRDGTSHDAVAARMVECLTGHDLFASAPSWDGKWLSALLRGAGWPRHALRLRDSDHAAEETVRALLGGTVEGAIVRAVLDEAATAGGDDPPAHRALPDARAEWRRWRRVRDAAARYAARSHAG